MNSNTFTKEQLLNSKDFSNRKDILMSLVNDKETITKEEAEKKALEDKEAGVETLPSVPEPPPKVEIDNPLDEIKKIKKLGLLGLVVKDSSSVSETVYFLQHFVYCLQCGNICSTNTVPWMRFRQQVLVELFTRQRQ